MLPMRAGRLLLGTLLAADAGTYAPVALGNKVALVKAAFSPNENMVPGSLTLADFTGSAPLVGSTGAQLTGIDPATGEQLITIKEPLGGWRWIATGAGLLPQTIYGFALLDTTLATLLGVALLPTPITINAIGDQIDLGTIQLRISAQPIS